MKQQLEATLQRAVAQALAAQSEVLEVRGLRAGEVELVRLERTAAAYSSELRVSLWAGAESVATFQAALYRGGQLVTARDVLLQSLDAFLAEAFAEQRARSGRPLN